MLKYVICCHMTDEDGPYSYVLPYMFSSELAARTWLCDTEFNKIITDFLTNKDADQYELFKIDSAQLTIDYEDVHWHFVISTVVDWDMLSNKEGN